jgi:FkbM family methyltransferase
MANVFIDCGSNVGQALIEFASMYNMDSSWFVESFEPNPYLIDKLKTNIANLPMKITTHNKAVWNNDGEVEFSLMIEESQGSSVKKLMDAGVCADEKSLSYRKHNSIINAPSIDISKILNNYTESDYIVVKLDIEGSEFCVIRKMLADNTIDLIDELYIEWHTAYMSSENENTQNNLIEKIKSRDIKYHTWN